MADDWIKVRSNLASDPAVIAVAGALRMDEFSVVGRLIVLWSWADQHSTTGTLPVTAFAVDRMVNKKGFSAALERVGWLHIEPDQVTIPHFERHNGDSAKARAGERERKRLQRSGQLPLDLPEECPDNHPDASPKSPGPEREKREKRDRESPVVPAGDDASKREAVEPAALLRARALFRMRSSTPLDDAQIRAWKKNKGAAAATSEEDWRLLEWAYAQTKGDAARWRRKDLAQLLNNWNAEISRSAEWFRASGGSTRDSKKSGADPVFHAPPADWKERYELVMGEAIPPGLTWTDLPDDVQRKIISKNNNDQ